jgi:hypothetical protein
VWPYLRVVLSWAVAGGASSTGAATLEDLSAFPAVAGAGDWLEFIFGITGAATVLDFPLRATLLGVGIYYSRNRVVLTAWAVFVALLFAVTFLDLPPVRWLFAVTFPWLVHHRPPQLVVVFASLLIGLGLAAAINAVRSLRVRFASRPAVARRLVVAGCLVLAFFAEGSVVSVYKTLEQVIGEQAVYGADDGAAMAWLRRNASAGDVLVNDNAADAGIWAPYKADMPILLPRSGSGLQTEMRQGILEHVVDLNSAPTARAAACALHVGYVYRSAGPLAFDEHQLPERAALERAPSLEEVFSSGDAAVFRIHLPCDS